jgi:RNA polymerase sigma factor (sigma-70 family)
MRDYLVNARPRWEKVRELVALCFTHEEIARLLGVCKATVSHDCRQLGIWGQGNRSDAFAVKLRRFAELALKPEPELTVNEAWLLRILEKNLGIAEVRREGYSVADALNYLMQPAYRQDKPRAVWLIEAIFGNQSSSFFASDEWSDYLRALKAREIRTPECFHDLSESFVRWLCDKYRGSIMPTWSDDTDDLLSQCLATLSPREEKVIRLRFGIGVCQCMTHAELGSEFGLTVSRIKQIESKALTRLSHPSRSKFLSKFVTPVGDILIRQFEKDRRQSEEPQLYQEDRAWFNMGLDEFAWSARTANCLVTAGLKIVGELVQKSESDMLRTKNFGRKSLKEVKAVLAKMGLCLGMKFPGKSNLALVANP